MSGGATRLECSKCSSESDFLEFVAEGECPNCKTDLSELESLL